LQSKERKWHLKIYESAEIAGKRIMEVDPPPIANDLKNDAY